MLIALLPYFVLLPHSSSVLSPFLSLCFLPPLCQSPLLFIPPSSLLWLQSISVFPPSVLTLLPASFLTSLIFIPPIQLLFITPSLLNLDHFFLFCISLLSLLSIIPFFIPSSFFLTLLASLFFLHHPPLLFNPTSSVLFWFYLSWLPYSPFFSICHFFCPVLEHKDWPPATELPFFVRNHSCQ